MIAGLLILVAALGATGVAAAPSEIKVFTDELAAFREHTLETHVNKASSGARRTPLQLMPEYSYGLRADWEFSLQLPMAFGSDATRLLGYRAELQYVAPHDAQRGFYWGVNLELARIDPPMEPGFWNAEVIPILGYRTDRWHFVANPGVDRALSGTMRSMNFEPALKTAYRIEGRNYLGLEYFAQGEGRVLYLAWDGRVRKSDFNVGLGRGLTDASDRWVVKVICEIAF